MVLALAFIGCKPSGKMASDNDQIAASNTGSLSQTRLGTVPPDCRESVVNSDGLHWAFVERNGQTSECRVWLDGRPGKWYALCDKLTLSQDGKKISYRAVKHGDANSYVVLNGKELHAEEGVLVLLFSPDGRRFAYIASRGDKKFVVVDGREGPHFKFIIYPGAGVGGDVVDRILFSPDGERYAYIGGTAEGKKVVVVDGKPGPTYEWSDLSLAIDGKPGPTYDIDYALVGSGTIKPPNPNESGSFWSDDSKRFLYFVMKEGEYVPVVEGKFFQQNGFEVKKAGFAPKSGKLVMLLHNKSENDPTKSFIVFFEGRRGPMLDELAPPDPEHFAPVFSADGNHITYSGKRADGYVVVRDDQEGPIVSDLPAQVVNIGFTSSLRFTADGSVEYLAVKDGNLYRIVQR